VNVYLVAYDVSDAERLRRVHRTMRGFGERLQYSVFVCLLTSKEKALLVTALREGLDVNNDRALIVDLGPRGRTSQRTMTFLGKRTELPERRAVVI